MCAERWQLASAPAWRIAAKAPATSAITSSTVTSSRTARAACAIQQARDLAREVRRDIRGCGAQIELGSRERALHGHVLSARGHHRRQLREEGARRISGGGENLGLRRQ